MKKNILYIAMACFALGFTACSDDPEDAVSKHVYGPDEAPYLRADANASIAYTAEFREGHITPQVIYLKDYAEQIQTKMKMTVDDMIAGVQSGKVVFYNINTARGIWNKTAPTKGSNGWWYTDGGLITDASNGAGSIELDIAQKALIVSVPDNTSAGLNFVSNVGFAIDNGKDYDDYVRFNLEVKVTNPGLVLVNATIPAGDYSAYTINFNDYASTIETCTGMSISDFIKACRDMEGPVAMYMVDQTTGEWNMDGEYNVSGSGIGYWLNENLEITNWGVEGFTIFIETQPDGDTCNIGRAPEIESGKEMTLDFVYAVKDDLSKFFEFRVNVVFE